MISPSSTQTPQPSLERGTDDADAPANDLVAAARQAIETANKAASAAKHAVAKAHATEIAAACAIAEAAGSAGGQDLPNWIPVQEGDSPAPAEPTWAQQRWLADSQLIEGAGIVDSGGGGGGSGSRDSGGSATDSSSSSLAASRRALMSRSGSALEPGESSTPSVEARSDDDPQTRPSDQSSKAKRDGDLEPLSAYLRLGEGESKAVGQPGAVIATPVARPDTSRTLASIRAGRALRNSLSMSSAAVVTERTDVEKARGVAVQNERNNYDESRLSKSSHPSAANADQTAVHKVPAAASLGILGGMLKAACDDRDKRSSAADRTDPTARRNTVKPARNLQTPSLAAGSMRTRVKRQGHTVERSLSMIENSSVAKSAATRKDAARVGNDPSAQQSHTVGRSLSYTFPTTPSSSSPTPGVVVPDDDRSSTKRMLRRATIDDGAQAPQVATGGTERGGDMAFDIVIDPAGPSKKGTAIICESRSVSTDVKPAIGPVSEDAAAVVRVPGRSSVRNLDWIPQSAANAAAMAAGTTAAAAENPMRKAALLISSYLSTAPISPSSVLKHTVPSVVRGEPSVSLHEKNAIRTASTPQTPSIEEGERFPLHSFGSSTLEKSRRNNDRGENEENMNGQQKHGNSVTKDDVSPVGSFPQSPSPPRSSAPKSTVVAGSSEQEAPSSKSAELHVKAQTIQSASVEGLADMSCSEKPEDLKAMTTHGVEEGSTLNPSFSAVDAEGDGVSISPVLDTILPTGGSCPCPPDQEPSPSRCLSEALPAEGKESPALNGFTETVIDTDDASTSPIFAASSRESDFTPSSSEKRATPLTSPALAHDEHREPSPTTVGKGQDVTPVTVSSAISPSSSTTSPIPRADDTIFDADSAAFTARERSGNNHEFSSSALSPLEKVTAASTMGAQVSVPPPDTSSPTQHDPASDVSGTVSSSTPSLQGEPLPPPALASSSSKNKLTKARERLVSPPVHPPVTSPPGRASLQRRRRHQRPSTLQATQAPKTASASPRTSPVRQSSQSAAQATDTAVVKDDAAPSKTEDTANQESEGRGRSRVKRASGNALDAQRSEPRQTDHGLGTCWDEPKDVDHRASTDRKKPDRADVPEATANLRKMAEEDNIWVSAGGPARGRECAVDDTTRRHASGRYNPARKKQFNRSKSCQPEDRDPKPYGEEFDDVSRAKSMVMTAGEEGVLGRPSSQNLKSALRVGGGGNASASAAGMGRGVPSASGSVSGGGDSTVDGSAPGSKKTRTRGRSIRRTVARIFGRRDH